MRVEGGGDGGGVITASPQGAVIRQEHGDRLRLALLSEEQRYLTQLKYWPWVPNKTLSKQSDTPAPAHEKVRSNSMFTA